MKCRLCLQDRELRNSHVIPEFMYQSLYDDKHRFQVIASRPSEPKRYAQKGIRERLLCEHCEQQIGVHERYVKGILANVTASAPEQEGAFATIRGIDYRSFRLFQHSILWRAGICSLEFFADVKLGLHEEKLRMLIRGDDPGEPRDYPCLITAVCLDGRSLTDLIVNPAPIRVQKVRAYRFVFGGLIWIWFVTSHRHDVGLSTTSLDPSGTLRIFRSELSQVQFIRKMAQELVARGKV